MVSEKLFSAREAAQVLGVSYPTLKMWIYKKKIRTIKTAGGHHRIPESQLDKFLHRAQETGDVAVAPHRIQKNQRTESVDRPGDRNKSERPDGAGELVHRRAAHHFDYYRRRSAGDAPKKRRDGGRAGKVHGSDAAETLAASAYLVAAASAAGKVNPYLRESRAARI